MNSKPGLVMNPYFHEVRCMFQNLKWVIIGLGFIVIIAWINQFPEGMVFAHADVVQYFNKDYVDQNFRHIWSNIVGEGGFSSVYAYYPFYVILFSVSDILGLNPSQQSTLFMIFLWGGAYLSCLFSLSLIADKKFSAYSLEANLFAMIYAINAYTFYAFWFIWGYSPFLSLYIFIPILVAATIEFFRERSVLRQRRLLGVLFVTHLCATVAYGNMPFFVSANLVLLGLAVVMELVNSQDTIKSFLIKIGLYLFIELAANGWAVLPQLPHLLMEIPVIDGGVFDFAGWVLWQRMSIWEVFTLIPEAQVYAGHHPFAIAQTLIVFGLAVWILISRRDYSYRYGQAFATFFVALIIVLLETKGKGFVPGAFAVWVYGNPFLGSLRSFGKVMIFLPFIVVLIFLFMMSGWEKRKQVLVLSAIIVANVITTYPMFMGILQTKESSALKEGENCDTAEYCGLVRVPPEYSEAAAVIRHDRLDGKILSIPYSVINSPGWNNNPSWKHVGVDPTTQLFSLPIVQMNTYHTFGKPYGQEWAEGGVSQEWIMRLAADLGVSYFLLHKDVRVDFVYPAKRILMDLEKKRLISKIYDSSVLTVYRAADAFRQPVVTLASGDHADEKSATTDVEKVNPTKYIVTLPPQLRENTVVLREGFSRQWKVYILPVERTASAHDVAKKLSWWETFFLPALSETSHTLYGGYGNSWKINANQQCRGRGCDIDRIPSERSFSLVIEYQSQRYIYVLLIITALVGLGGAMLLFRQFYASRRAPRK